MATINGSATDELALLDTVRSFVSTNATLVGASQAWTVLRYAGYSQIVASSETGGGSEAFRAVDGLTTTQWTTAQNAATPSTWGLKLVTALQPGAIAITSPATWQQTPKTFTLEYSDNGTIWTVAQTFTNITWTAAGVRTQLSVSATPGAHLWWRLNISANNGNASYTGMAEFELLELRGGVWFNHAVGASLLLRAPGLAGTEQLFMGIQAYNLPTSDVYNWQVAGFTGYVDSAAFSAQPGASPLLGMPLRRGAMRYWLVANGQRLVIVAQVDTTYQTCYLGKILPYGSPAQYPYPLLVGAPLASNAAIRYSDVSASAPTLAYKGTRNNLRLRFSSGAWLTPDAWPWYTPNSADLVRDTGGQYALLPVILNDSGPNIYGELDGVAFVSGFGNAVENTVTVGANNWLVVQDVNRTGAEDYCAVLLA